MPTKGRESIKYHRVLYTCFCMEVMYIVAKASHTTAVYFTRPEKCKAPVGSHPDRKTEASLECSKWKVLGSRNYWQAGNEGWEAPSNYLHHLLHENGGLPALSPQLLGTSTTSEKPQENHAYSLLLSKSSRVSLAASSRMTRGKGVWEVKVQVSAPRCREGYRRGINYGEWLKAAVVQEPSSPDGTYQWITGRISCISRIRRSTSVTILHLHVIGVVQRTLLQRHHSGLPTP